MVSNAMMTQSQNNIAMTTAKTHSKLLQYDETNIHDTANK